MRKTPVAGIHNRKGEVRIMRTALWWSLALVLCLGMASAYAQDENKSEEPAKAQQPNTFHAYRVGFAINELEGGKKINGSALLDGPEHRRPPATQDWNASSGGVRQLCFKQYSRQYTVSIRGCRHNDPLQAGRTNGAET